MQLICAVVAEHVNPPHAPPALRTLGVDTVAHRELPLLHAPYAFHKDAPFCQLLYLLNKDERPEPSLTVPGSIVVRTPGLHPGNPGSIPGQGDFCKSTFNWGRTGTPPGHREGARSDEAGETTRPMPHKFQMHPPIAMGNSHATYFGGSGRSETYSR